jgi:hypothetical protein
MNKLRRRHNKIVRNYEKRCNVKGGMLHRDAKRGLNLLLNICDKRAITPLIKCLYLPAITLSDSVGVRGNLTNSQSIYECLMGDPWVPTHAQNFIYNHNVGLSSNPSDFPRAYGITTYVPSDHGNQQHIGVSFSSTPEPLYDGWGIQQGGRQRLLIHPKQIWEFGKTTSDIFAEGGTRAGAYDVLGSTLVLGKRSSTQTTLFINGNQVGNGTGLSGNLPTLPVMLYTYDPDARDVSNRVLTGYTIGLNMTSTQVFQYSTAWDRCQKLIHGSRTTTVF